MNHTRLYLAATIIAVALVVGFLASVPRARDGEVVTDREETQELSPVALRTTYKKGVHTITGSVIAPDACASLEAVAETSGDPVEAIIVALTLTEEEGVCLEVPTPHKFSVTVEAEDELPIRATINGVVATTTEL